MLMLRIMMAQANFKVGDIDANTQKIIELGRQAQTQGADIVVFPELALTGYPPEDLLLRPSLHLRVESALAQISQSLKDLGIILGYPAQREGKLYNMAGFFYQGQTLGEYAKHCLPNHQVFDEKRYFHPGTQACVVHFRGVRLGLSICEDLWHPEPIMAARDAGAQLMISLNASPFHMGKLAQRRALLQESAINSQLPIIYTNLVGGQDELVFDGASFAVNAQGQICVQAPAYQENLYPVEVCLLEQEACIQQGPQAPQLDADAELYQALVLGLADYVNKNGFQGVVLGLSGGIDSALSAAIAVDALGPERVQAVMMPYHYTSSMSLQDAAAQAKMLGIDYQVLPIAPMVENFMDTLAPCFAGHAKDTTEENLQARTRGVLLMALSNKLGLMVLTTGNKSEMAVGYATLYGDMVGGFNALKDVYKTRVFALASYRNTLSPAIPERVISRPPSAELAPDQKDEDSLPPYPVLDAILHLYIEGDQSQDAIIHAGFTADDVRRVIRLVDLSEYKRRQAAPGVRVSERGFGRDRRYPITQGWIPGV
nr:NAD+ synthase [Allopseudospirillum japonicum]